MSNGISRKMIPIGAIRKSNGSGTENLNYAYADDPLHHIETADLVAIVRDGELRFIHIADLFYPAIKIQEGKAFPVQNYDKLVIEFNEFKKSVLHDLEESYKKIHSLERQITFLDEEFSIRLENNERELKGTKSKIEELQQKENDYSESYRDIRDTQISSFDYINKSIIIFNSKVDDQFLDITKKLETVAEQSLPQNFIPEIFGSHDEGKAIYTEQEGTYQRIGNQILLQISMGWINHSGTGDLLLGSIPYDLNYKYARIEMYLDDVLVFEIASEKDSFAEALAFTTNENNIITPIPMAKNGILHLSLHTFI